MFFFYSFINSSLISILFDYFSVLPCVCKKKKLECGKLKTNLVKYETRLSMRKLCEYYYCKYETLQRYLQLFRIHISHTFRLLVYFSLFHSLPRTRERFPFSFSDFFVNPDTLSTDVSILFYDK